PCRSRPSTTWRCAQAGQRLTTLSGKKLGTANRQTTNAVSRIAAAFHFEMYSMDRPGSDLALRRRSARFVLHRLALGLHARHHRADLAHAHTVRDLHLDLVVADDFDDLAHQPPGGNDPVTAPQVLHQLLVLLGPLLLRPQDQKIHDHEDQDEGQQLHHHVI